MQARRVVWMSLAVVLATGCRVKAETPIAAAEEVRITIYNEARLPDKVLVKALDGLRLILEHAKVRSRAVAGDLADPEASLFMYVALPPRCKAAPCCTRRDIALKIIGVSPRALPEKVLGMSSPFAQFGLNVRIFNDHIREAAAAHGGSYATVLSFAMAHEIGHVLLRSGAHTSWGIMSSVWTEFEYRAMSRRGLLFSAEDAKTMKANLCAPICAAPAPGPRSGEHPRTDEGATRLTFTQAESVLPRPTVAARQERNRATDPTGTPVNRPKRGPQ